MLAEMLPRDCRSCDTDWFDGVTNCSWRQRLPIVGNKSYNVGSLNNTVLLPGSLIAFGSALAADFALTVKANVRLQEFLVRAGILVLASHSPDFLKQFCDSGLWLSEGKVVESGNLDQIYGSYVKHMKEKQAAL